MKSTAWIAMMSTMGWCQSLGDGCAPLLSPGEATTAVNSGDEGSSTQAASSETPPTSGPGESGSGATGTTSPTEATTSLSAETMTAGDSTSSSTSSAASTEATTVAAPTCGDGELNDLEECDTEPDPGMGVLECDADCKAIRVVDLAAGSEHACVLLSDGRVRCWGDNTYGQLGAVDEHEDVKLEGDELLDAGGPGASDFTKDVAIDTGNGRVFAGGATSCVTSSLAAKTWCWGHGFAGATPQPTIGRYSAIAVRDVVDPGTQDWWMCGLAWEDPEHRLRCWGSLDDDNKTLFESLDNPGTCFNAVTEADAGSRLLDLFGKPPKLDVGKELACAPSSAMMLCAGNDGTSCDGDALKKPCVADSFKACPASCTPTPCTKSALDVGLWTEKLCYINSQSTSLVECTPPSGEKYSLIDLCAPAVNFTADLLSVSQDFWCAVDVDQPPEDQVCCVAFDKSPSGLVELAGTPDRIVKAAAQSDGILLLDERGRVLIVVPAGGAWTSQDAL